MVKQTRATVLRELQLTLPRFYADFIGAVRAAEDKLMQAQDVRAEFRQHHDEVARALDAALGHFRTAITDCVQSFAGSDEGMLSAISSSDDGRRGRCDGKLWLVLDGVRREIPNADFTRFFDGDLPEDGSLRSISIGPAFAGNVHLEKLCPSMGICPECRPEVYLVDGDLYRWVNSPDAMRRYGFSFGRVRSEPYREIAHLGPPITA